MIVFETATSITNPNAPTFVRNPVERDILAAGVNLWFDASGPWTIKDAGAITSITERVTGDRYVNQFTAPTEIESGSSKAMRMIGFSTLKSESLRKIFPSSGSYSTIIVSRVSVPPGSGGALISGRASTGQSAAPLTQQVRITEQAFDVSSGGSGINGINRTIYPAAAVNDGDWHVVSVSVQAGVSGRSVIRLDQITANDLGLNIGTVSETSRELLIGGELGPGLGGGQGFNNLLVGDISLIMVFPDVVFHTDTAARDLAEGYAMDRRAALYET